MFYRMGVLWLGLIGMSSAEAGALPIHQCREIDESGVYELTQHLVSTGPVCITITANDVVLNLNHHRISGPTEPGSRRAAWGILVTADRAQISNGVVAHFGGGGVWLRGSAYSVVDHILFTANAKGVTLSPSAGGVPASHNEIMFNLFTHQMGRSLMLDGGMDNRVVANTFLENRAVGLVLNGGGGNIVGGNFFVNNAGSGIQVQGKGEQKITQNHARRNHPYDLQDDTAGCGGAVWQANNFGVRSQRCIR